MSKGAWQMTEYQQWTSLLVVSLVVGAIVAGLCALWRAEQRERAAKRQQGSIEQYTEDFIAQNVDVLEVLKDHPVNMPRWKGWRDAGTIAPCAGRLVAPQEMSSLRLRAVKELHAHLHRAETVVGEDRRDEQATKAHERTGPSGLEELLSLARRYGLGGTAYSTRDARARRRTRITSTFPETARHRRVVLA